jgi:chromosome segregation ATPase
MTEQNLDAPEQVRKFAPKRSARSNRHPTDQAGEALIGMLHEAARAADENTNRAMELVHDLTQQLQAAEERIGQLERDIEHFRARATGAERWLERIEQEIQQNLIGPMTAKQS